MTPEFKQWVEQVRATYYPMHIPSRSLENIAAVFVSQALEEAERLMSEEIDNAVKFLKEEWFG
jgi:hypothetical protein